MTCMGLSLWGKESRLNLHEVLLMEGIKIGGEVVVVGGIEAGQEIVIDVVTEEMEDVLFGWINTAPLPELTTG